MKKYISPELVVVKLHATCLLSESVLLDNDPSDANDITDSNDILTREVITGKSVWDEEW